MAGPADTYIGYGKAWATVSNTPFREYKHWVHEGGISTPLIAHWPASIKRNGQLDATPSHLVDLMATAVDVSGATYPKVFHDGQTIKPMEGKSLFPVFQGHTIDRDALYWEHEGNRAVRVGDDKLVAKGANGKWELYNIAQDRSEQHDLSNEQPGRVEELKAKWEAYAMRANVLPLNPNAKKAANKKYNRKQKRFELSAGDKLPTEKAPFVEKRGFTVTAKATVKGDGVVVAQGGSSHGWSLYIQDGQLKFAITRGNRRTEIDTDTDVHGDVTVTANVAKDGLLTLSINDTLATSAKLPGTIMQQPADGLEVGRDDTGRVGLYQVPFKLEGVVEHVVIEVQK